MASNNATMLNWLRFHQCRDDFVNSYYFALLLTNLPKAGFDIPIHILIEEFEKEEHSIDEHNISTILRDFIVHLLDRMYPKMGIKPSNYCKHLNEFLNNKRLYLNGASNPLLPNKSFPSLSSEVKLWVFCQLIQNGGLSNDNPPEIGTDSQGNSYYVVNGRLYIKYGKILSEIAKEDKKNETNLTPLEKYCQQHRWKQLAETSKYWKNVALILENFNENEIAAKITKKFEIARRSILTDEEKEESRQIFTAYINSLRPQPSPRRGHTKMENDPSPDPPPPSYEDLARMAVLNINDRSPSNGIPNNKQGTTRCIYFPNCRNGDGCKFLHPSDTCRNFGSDRCPGLKCKFIHPDCPKRGDCTGLECVYEHPLCRPTLLRISHAEWMEERKVPRPQNEERPSGRTGERLQNERMRATSRGPSLNRRPRSQSRGGFERAETAQHNRTQNVRDAEPTRNDVTGNQSNVPLPFSKKDLRCHFWPHCRIENCEFTHPSRRCESFPNCNRGRDCPFLHGDCSKDGGCRNEYCPYEHRKQRPPRQNHSQQRNNANGNGNLRRSTSKSNLSMMSGGSRR